MMIVVIIKIYHFFLYTKKQKNLFQKNFKCVLYFLQSLVLNSLKKIFESYQVKQMYHQNHNTAKIQELRGFLSNVSSTIIACVNIESKGFKIRQNFILAYTMVYDMCNEKPSLQEKMLQEFKNCLISFIETYVDQSQQQRQFRFSLDNSTRVIGWFNVLWNKFVKFMITISKKVFVYLDRNYLPGTDEHSLYKVGLKIFKKNVCHQRNMKFFEDCYFKELREIRQLKVIHNNDLLKFSDAIAIIDNQQLITNLTNRFIQQTTGYYQSFYQQNYTLPSVMYYNKVNNTFFFEEVLVKMCICINTFEIARVFRSFSQILVKQFTQIFCGAQSATHGLQKMFETQNVDFMRVVNDVYKKFEGFNKIKETYYEYVLQKGEKIIQKYKLSPSQQKSLPIIDQIHQFYKSNITTLTKGFNKRNELLVTLNNAMQKIISRQQRFSSILYTYCSRSRLQGTFDVNKEKIDMLFDKILSKDEFVSLYESELFRKIAGSAVDLVKEEQFVNYLNGICGSEVTHKLVKKIKDVSDAPKASDLLRDMPGDIQFSVSVLSLPLWEKKFIDQISLNISLPSSLDLIWKGIEKNFIELEPKKKLIPLPFENRLVLEVRFNKKNFLMKCNLIQASIFIFLASKSYTSEQDIITQLSIQKNVVQSTMETFELIPHLLLKTSLGDFIVNWYYDQAQTIIDLASKTQQTNKQMQKVIKQDRQILVEAAIVRFVKRAKRGTFEEIVQGVVKAIRLFKPLPQIIKASVDKLVKKGFVEEVEGGFLEYVQ